jgi:PadR family transcriptional regulator
MALPIDGQVGRPIGKGRIVECRHELGDRCQVGAGTADAEHLSRHPAAHEQVALVTCATVEEQRTGGGKPKQTEARGGEEPRKQRGRPFSSPLDNQVKSGQAWRSETTWMASESKERVELLQGTLDLIVLRALHTMGAQHAYGLAARLEQAAQPSLTLNQGTLYPALVRLEQKGWIKGTWQRTESNREARYYTITKAGVRGLEKQTERWRRLAGLVDKLLLNEG